MAFSWLLLFHYSRGHMTLYRSQGPVSQNCWWFKGHMCNQICSNVRGGHFFFFLWRQSCLLLLLSLDQISSPPTYLAAIINTFNSRTPTSTWRSNQTTHLDDFANCRLLQVPSFLQSVSASVNKVTIIIPWMLGCMRLLTYSASVKQKKKFTRRSRPKGFRTINKNKRIKLL